MTHCYVQYIDEKTTGGMARWNSKYFNKLLTDNILNYI